VCFGGGRGEPNLSDCTRSSKWDEPSFIGTGTGAVMGAGSLRLIQTRNKLMHAGTGIKQT